LLELVADADECGRSFVRRDDERRDQKGGCHKQSRADARADRIPGGDRHYVRGAFVHARDSCKGLNECRNRVEPRVRIPRHRSTQRIGCIRRDALCELATNRDFQRLYFEPARLVANRATRPRQQLMRDNRQCVLVGAAVYAAGAAPLGCLVWDGVVIICEWFRNSAEYVRESIDDTAPVGLNVNARWLQRAVRNIHRMRVFQRSADVLQDRNDSLV